MSAPHVDLVPVEVKKSGTGHLGRRVTDSSKFELEIKPGSSRRAARDLECRAISPGPLFIVLRLPLPSV